MKAFSHCARILIHRFASSFRLKVAIVMARLKGLTPCVIVLTERMGDLVACQPVARQYKNSETCIIWICASQYASLVRLFPSVDVIVPVVCLTEASYLVKSVPSKWLIDLRLHGKECPHCRKPVTKQGAQARITTENYYTMGSLLDAFSLSAGITIDDKAPEIGDTNRNITLLKRRFGIEKRYIVVHCASEESARNWQDSHWDRLVKELLSCYDIQIVEIGGEIGRLHPCAGTINCCGKLALDETIELIKNAFLFIGVDSGPAHFANAVRTPGIVLLGKYRAFDKYLPYSGFYGGSGNVIIFQYWKELMYMPFDIVNDKARMMVKALMMQGEMEANGVVSIECPPSDLLYNIEIKEVVVLLDAMDHGFFSKEVKISDSRSSQLFIYRDDPQKKISITDTVHLINRDLPNCITVDGRPLVLLSLSHEKSDLVDVITKSIESDFEKLLFIKPVFKIHISNGTKEKGKSFNKNQNELVFLKFGHFADFLKDITSGEPFAPTHPTIFGNIDHVEKEQGLTIRGWCVLPSYPRRPADRIFLCKAFPDGTAVVVQELTDYRDERPDIAAYFGDKYVWFSGWHASIADGYYVREPLLIVAVDSFLCETYLLGNIP